MLCIFHRHLSYSNTYNRLKINRLHNTDCILSKKLESNRKDDLNVNIWTVSVLIFCCINEKGEINENISFFHPSFISATVKMTCSAVSLPSEIVSNIAQYLEQHLLHNCVLVCQNWRPIFERILYRHPSLSSEFAIDNFISTIRQRASCSPGTSSAAARHATGFDVRSMALETSFISMQQTRTYFSSVLTSAPWSFMQLLRPILQMLYGLRQICHQLPVSASWLNSCLARSYQLPMFTILNAFRAFLRNMQWNRTSWYLCCSHKRQYDWISQHCPSVLH